MLGCRKEHRSRRRKVASSLIRPAPPLAEPLIWFRVDFDRRFSACRRRKSVVRPRENWARLISRVPLSGIVIALLFVVRAGHAQGTVLGLVTDQTQTPVRDAEVTISKTGVRARTDSAGRFDLRGVQAGPQRVDVRRIGYAPTSVGVRIRNGDTVAIHVLLTSRAQMLPQVPVEGITPPLVPYRLSGFERRRTSGVGHFLTAANLASERYRPMGDVLTRLPGVFVVQSSTAACLATTRGAQSFQNSAAGWCGNKAVGGHYCPAAVFLDGVSVYGGYSEEIFNLNALRADQVAGVEFYSGPATMPREFSAPRGTCGVLVIWTKS